jgi:hypothetical protein
LNTGVTPCAPQRMRGDSRTDRLLGSGAAQTSL